MHVYLRVIRRVRFIKRTRYLHTSGKAPVCRSQRYRHPLTASGSWKSCTMSRFKRTQYCLPFLLDASPPAACSVLFLTREVKQVYYNVKTTRLYECGAVDRVNKRGTSVQHKYQRKIQYLAAYYTKHIKSLMSFTKATKNKNKSEECSM